MRASCLMASSRWNSPSAECKKERERNRHWDQDRCGFDVVSDQYQNPPQTSSPRKRVYSLLVFTCLHQWHCSCWCDQERLKWETVKEGTTRALILEPKPRSRGVCCKGQKASRIDNERRDGDGPRWKRNQRKIGRRSKPVRKTENCYTTCLCKVGRSHARGQHAVGDEYSRQGDRLGMAHGSRWCRALGNASTDTQGKTGFPTTDEGSLCLSALSCVF